MRTAVVTGVSGFVGWHMAKELLDSGFIVNGLDINEPAGSLLKSERFSFKQVDLTKPKTINNRECVDLVRKANMVFHIAGLFDYEASLDRLFEVNVLGTRNLLDLIMDVGEIVPSVIVWGAGGVFGDFTHLPKDNGQTVPATEDMPVRTNNPYLLSKWYTELEALRFYQRFELPVSVIRPSAIYGPRSQYGMAKAILLIGQGVLPPFIVGSGCNFGALVHVDDIVGAARFLAEIPKAAGQVYHVSDDGLYTVGQMTKHMAKELGVPFVPFLKLPKPLAWWLIGQTAERAKQMGVRSVVDYEFVNLVTMNSRLSNKKLKSLGYVFEYSDTLVGLSQTIAWYKKVGWV